MLRACRLRSGKDQTRPQQVPHTSPHVKFLEDPIFLDKGEFHITLLSFRLQLHGSRSQVHFKRYNTSRQYNSVVSCCIPETSPPDTCRK